MAGLYQRGGVWWGRVQRKGRDLRRSLKTTAKEVARRRLRSWLEELDRVAFGERPRRTFDDLGVRFIDEHLPRLKPSSAKRYAVSLDALTDGFEGLYLDQITSAKLSEFETGRRREGVRIPEGMRGKRRPKAISAGGIRRDFACLSSMFGFAIELEWCDFNPVAGYLKRAKKRGLREAAPRRRYLSIEEEAKLLAAAADRHGSQDLADAIAIAIDTGLRRGEQFTLRRGRLAASGPVLRLDKNAIEVSEDTSKNSRAREVPLLPRTRAILAQKPAQLRSDYVLINGDTGERYKAMNKGLAGAARRAKIPPLTWHDLRRTCGCRLLQEHGMSMEKVGRWLGHSSVLVTEQIYAFLENEHLQAAVTGTKPGTGTADSGPKAKESRPFRC
ncbi:MAG TPA: site-specific integrase [Stellaceae bacterium]|nr:site-specific integrase [Stellaceae bacterium]